VGSTIDMSGEQLLEFLLINFCEGQVYHTTIGRFDPRSVLS
jgi:hypothetical protein